MSTKIMITCPETTAAIWTGFRAPPGTALAGLKSVKLNKCPECGHAHTWDADAAYWQEDELPTVSLWANFVNIWRRPQHT